MKRWNDIRVGTRLSSCITGLLVAMLALAATTTFYLIVTMDHGQRVVRGFDQRILASARWYGASQLLSERIVASLNTSDGDLATYYENEIEKGWKLINLLKEEIAKDSLADTERASLNLAQSAENEVNAKVKEVVGFSNSGDISNVRSATEKALKPALENYRESIAIFLKNEESARDLASAKVDQQRREYIAYGLFGALVLLMAGACVARFISASLTRPLAQAIQVAQRISEGKISEGYSSVKVSRRDEFGELQDALHQMAEGLNHLVSRVRFGTTSVSVATAEIASGNQDLAHRTEQTVSSLQITASTMAELAEGIGRSAEAARQASQLVDQAADTATIGGAAMSEVVRIMSEISEASKRIADITTVIDGIAFQTNILALNAAVEAARAGDQGRGFAVVAAEVRTLAQRSSQAAREIRELIATSLETVSVGSEKVSDAGGTMHKIVGDVHHVRALMGDISRAVSEQSEGVGQINAALLDLEGVTQQNAALVEQASAATESLRDQASSLARLVSVFEIDEENESQVALGSSNVHEYRDSRSAFHLIGS